MRYHEIAQFRAPKSPQPLTLRAVNQLKKLRRYREKQRARKLALVGLMYGDADASHDKREGDLERERLEFELEKAVTG